MYYNCSRSDIRNILKKQIDAISTDYEYTFQSPRRQDFCLPFTIISYITQCPEASPFGLKNLQQTCKYFFAKKPILVIDRQALCDENKISASHYYWNPLILNLNKKLLFWVTHHLVLDKPSTTILKTIYRNSTNTLKIWSATLTFTEFKLLTSDSSKIKKLEIDDSSINYFDGKNVPIYKILKNFPNAENIEFKNDRENFSKEILELLSLVKFSNPLQRLALYITNVSSCFDPLLLCQFFIQNLDPTLSPDSYGVIFVKCNNGAIIKKSLDDSIKEISNHGEKNYIRIHLI